MNARTQFLLQLLQKLGTPLTAAVSAHAQGASEAQDAQTVATLLSESVKAGISLSQSMNLKTGEGDADAVRVAMASLAGNLLAGQYRASGRLPGEADSARIVKALESVIVFSDNFGAGAEHAKRLETLDGTPPFFDPLQTGLYAMHAMVPVIAAISEFSFGQAEPRLAQDVAERLGALAKEMLTKLSGAENDAMAELVILQALGQLYGAAHRAETAKLKQSGAQDGASIESVWAAFDRQTGMVEALLSSMAGQSSAGRGGGVRPQATVQAQEAPVEAPPAAAPPAQAAPAQPANPMSFFKKK